MNDTPANGGNGADTPQKSPVIINGQFIKDLSFEAPNSPSILPKLQGAQPDVQVNVDVQANKIDAPNDQNLYEVVLDIAAELKVNGEVGFIVELKYGGVFTINVPNEHLGAMLLIECPRLLFPYARNIIGDATRDGGFVPLMLQPIDFVALFQQTMAKQHGTPNGADESGGDKIESPDESGSDRKADT